MEVTTGTISEFSHNKEKLVKKDWNLFSVSLNETSLVD